MDSKKLFLIGGLVLLIVIIAGSVLLARNSKKSSEDAGANSNDEIVDLVELSAEDVGLVLSLQKNNQQVVMELSELTDVESFEYELSYDALESGESVSRGTFGSGPNPEEKSKKIIRRVMDLGTCSSGVCKYDKGVKDIEFSLRVNLKNGESGIIEEAISLE